MGVIGKAKIYDSDKFWRIAHIEDLMKVQSELEKTILYIEHKRNNCFTEEKDLYYKHLAGLFRERLLDVRDKIKELVR